MLLISVYYLLLLKFINIVHSNNSFDFHVNYVVDINLLRKLKYINMK